MRDRELPLKAVALLGAVLALSTADLGVISALAVPLKHSFGIDNADIGVLVGVSTALGAVASLPMGFLVDRVNRVNLLSASIVAWCLVMAVSGAAVSYPMLLISRLGLGTAVAVAGPATASLAGDLFPTTERGRLYGYILSGEIVGVAAGVLVCGNIVAALSWRFGFWVLIPPGLLLAWVLHRLLPEPARGANRTRSTEIVPRRQSIAAGQDAAGGAQPHERLVLHTDPVGRSLWWAVRYLLSIRTNVALIVASALGYFYFTGLQTFAVVYLRGRYGLGQSTSTTLLVLIGSGAIIGLILAGRIADSLGRRRYPSARPVVAGVALVMCAALLAAGLLASPMPVAIGLLFLAAAALGGANPPLDAARLDIVHPRLWGRAEGVRTVLRSAFVAMAPIVFGLLSTVLTMPNDASGSGGIRLTLLIMITMPLLGGLILLVVARRTYPRDVATARASVVSRGR